MINLSGSNYPCLERISMAQRYTSHWGSTVIQCEKYLHMLGFDVPQRPRPTATVLYVSNYHSPIFVALWYRIVIIHIVHVLHVDGPCQAQTCLRTSEASLGGSVGCMSDWWISAHPTCGQEGFGPHRVRHHSFVDIFYDYSLPLTDLRRTAVITKTCPYNFDPLKPHFYIAKLWFTCVYLNFLISAQEQVVGTR